MKPLPPLPLCFSCLAAKIYAALAELVDTENGYTDDLRIFVRVYLARLHALVSFSNHEQRTIARNAPTLLALHETISSAFSAVDRDLDWKSIAAHTLLHRSCSSYNSSNNSTSTITKSSSSSQLIEPAYNAILAPVLGKAIERIAAALVAQAPAFAAYEDFCSQHADALTLLSRPPAAEWNQFESLCANGSVNRRLRMVDYAIKPIQRICRYPLILSQLLKYVSTQSDADGPLICSQRAIDLLTTALNVTKTAAQHVDAALRQRQLQVKSDLIAARFTSVLPQQFNPMSSSSTTTSSSTASAAAVASASLSSSSMSNTASASHSSSPAPSLGPTFLAGSLYYIDSNSSPPKVKYYGAFLYASHLVLAKIRKKVLYEPRHWFPLRAFHIHSSLPCLSLSSSSSSLFPILLTNNNNVFELGAAGPHEREVWLQHLYAAKLHTEKSWLDNIASHPTHTPFDETAISSVPLSDNTHNAAYNGNKMLVSHMSTSSSSSASSCHQTAPSTPVASTTIPLPTSSPPSPPNRRTRHPYRTRSLSAIASIIPPSTSSSQQQSSSTSSPFQQVSSTPAAPVIKTRLNTMLGKSPESQRLAIDLKLIDIYSDVLLSAKSKDKEINATHSSFSVSTTPALSRNNSSYKITEMTSTTNTTTTTTNSAATTRPTTPSSAGSSNTQYAPTSLPNSVPGSVASLASWFKDASATSSSRTCSSAHATNNTAGVSASSNVGTSSNTVGAGRRTSKKVRVKRAKSMGPWATATFSLASSSHHSNSNSNASLSKRPMSEAMFFDRRASTAVTITNAMALTTTTTSSSSTLNATPAIHPAAVSNNIPSISTTAAPTLSSTRGSNNSIFDLGLGPRRRSAPAADESPKPINDLRRQSEDAGGHGNGDAGSGYDDIRLDDDDVDMEDNEDEDDDDNDEFYDDQGSDGDESRHVVYTVSVGGTSWLQPRPNVTVSQHYHNIPERSEEDYETATGSNTRPSTACSSSNCGNSSSISLRGRNKSLNSNKSSKSSKSNASSASKIKRKQKEEVKKSDVEMPSVSNDSIATPATVTSATTPTVISASELSPPPAITKSKSSSASSTSHKRKSSLTWSKSVSVFVPFPNSSSMTPTTPKSLSETTSWTGNNSSNTGNGGNGGNGGGSTRAAAVRRHSIKMFKTLTSRMSMSSSSSSNNNNTSLVSASSSPPPLPSSTSTSIPLPLPPPPPTPPRTSSATAILSSSTNSTPKAANILDNDNSPTPRSSPPRMRTTSAITATITPRPTRVVSAAY